MGTVSRLLGYGTKPFRAAAEARLRRSLQSSARPPREAAVLEDLRSRSALVVVAHPDDEVIAAGALIAHSPRIGVICITDGAPRRPRYARAAGFNNWMDYAFARRAEAKAALALLNREIEPMYGLGIADQEAFLNLVPTTYHLFQSLRNGFDCVITHAYEGGHPDHDSTAFCVHAACALIAKQKESPPLIVEAPLYNAAAGTLVKSCFVKHRDAGPTVSFPLSSQEQALKRRMFDCYRTQRDVLRTFSIVDEKFRQAPRYHFSAPPHVGEVGYVQYMEASSGRAWRRQAWRAAKEIGLLAELA